MGSEKDPDVKFEIASGTWTRFVLNDIGLRAHAIKVNDEFEHRITDAESSNSTKKKLKLFICANRRLKCQEACIRRSKGRE